MGTVVGGGGVTAGEFSVVCQDVFVALEGLVKVVFLVAGDLERGRGADGGKKVVGSSWDAGDGTGY